MRDTYIQLRRWAAGLTVFALPLIAVALAPSGIADRGAADTGPCAWDLVSTTCLEWQAGGVDFVCGMHPGSIACAEASAAASGRGLVLPSSP